MIPVDLPDEARLPKEAHAELAWSGSLRWEMDVYWLREAIGGALEGGCHVRNSAGEAQVDISLVGAIRSEVKLDPQGRLVLRLCKQAPAGAPLFVRVHACLTRGMTGEIGAALETRCSAELGRRWESLPDGATLIECGFAFTVDGLALYDRALAGDWRWLAAVDPEQARLTEDWLAQTLRQPARLELHMPTLDRKQWSRRGELLPGLRVEACEDGRLRAETVDAPRAVERRVADACLVSLAGGRIAGRAEPERWSLSFTHRRLLPAAAEAAFLGRLLSAYGFSPDVRAWLEETATAGPREALDVGLALEVAASALPAWSAVPPERSAAFHQALAAVSAAVQSALRLWIPFIHGGVPERYQQPATAWPVLAYAASRIFRAESPTELTWDPLNPVRMKAVFGSVTRNLPEQLDRVEKFLRAAGAQQTAALYAPRGASRIVERLRRDPHPFRSLLVLESSLMGELVKAANFGRETNDAMRGEHSSPPRSLLRFSNEFAHRLHGKLRKLAGEDCTWLGALLLVEATHALAGALGFSSRVDATLRIHCPNGCPSGCADGAHLVAVGTR